jgi:membrane-anchored glycerophosphoryl diester phosphodiesterase (GDPDase)
MTVSISTLWRESLAFARRESALLVPLALSTLAMGQAGMIIATAIQRQAPVGGGVWLIFLLSYFLVLIGQLSIAALVLKPGSSVAEAINLAVRQSPKALAVLLMILCVLLLALLPCVALMAQNGMDLSSPNPQLTMSDMLYLSPALGLALWIGVRLLSLHAVLVNENATVGEAVRKSFRLTKGHVLPLLAATVGFVVGSQILQILAGVIVTLIFSAFAGGEGMDLGVAVMVALGAGMASAIPAMLAAIFAALFYRQLNDKRDVRA